MKKIFFILILILTSCQPMQQAIVPLATLISANVVITSPQKLDCEGQTVRSIKISNTHDVTIEDCVISGGNINLNNSYNVTFRDLTLTKTGAGGGAISLNSTAAGLTHHILIENFHCIGGGAMGWCIGGSESPITDITVRNGLIEDVGQAGTFQTHGMYIENWQGFLIEDVTILRSWNSGIKIVGAVNDGIINRVVINDSGRSGASGGGVMFGQSGRISVMDAIDVINSNFDGAYSGGLYVLSPVTGLTVDNNVFKNTRTAMTVNRGSKGWSVTNNTGWIQANSARALIPLYVENDAAITANFFDYNNWYFDGKAPIRLGGTSLSMSQWQARGVDLHSISTNPETPQTPTGTPTATKTVIPPSVTPSASPTSTSSLVFTPSETSTPTATRTAIPPTGTFTPTQTATPTMDCLEDGEIVICYRIK